MTAATGDGTTIEPRPLGRSGLSVAPLVLGGNVFGWTANEAASFAVLDAFVEGGGTMIDTADSYSSWVPGHQGGESETVIGAWLKARGHRDRVQIASKVGFLEGKLAPAAITRAIDGSLRRLGTDHVDLYFAHRDDPAVPLEETLATLDGLVRAGKVRALGASNYSPERLVAALDVSAREGFAPFTVLQPQYSLVERDFEASLQQICRERGLGVVTYYALASGFLTGKYRTEADTRRTARGGSAARYLNPRGLAVLDALDAVAAETGATPAQVALAWIMAQPGVTAPIASATSADQVRDLVAAMGVTLGVDQVARLDMAGAA